jgi:hypothetical protein
VLRRDSRNVVVGGMSEGYMRRTADEHRTGRDASPPESTIVKSVIEMFREKYGAGDVMRYYSKLDVAVVAALPR